MQEHQHFERSKQDYSNSSSSRTEKKKNSTMNYKIQKNVIDNAEEPPPNRLHNIHTLVWQEKECKLVCYAEIIEN